MQHIENRIVCQENKYTTYCIGGKKMVKRAPFISEDHELEGLFNIRNEKKA